LLHRCWPGAIKYVQVKDVNLIRSSIEYAKKQYSVNKIHSNVGGYLKSLIEKEALIISPFEKKQQEESESKAKKLIEEKKREQFLLLEYQKYRNLRLNKLMSEMKEEDKQAYFSSRSEFEKTIIYDEKGKLRADRANGILKVYLAEQNGLEDTEEAFKKWVRESKEVESLD
jgi:hypothetical protein